MQPKLYAVLLPSALTYAQGDTLCLAADTQRAARYRRRPDSVGAQQSLAAQALLRISAARELGIAASDVCVAYTPAGKPYLPGTDLHCGVSHTAGLCVCAFADAPIGMDAEAIRPVRLRVASRVFSPSELNELQNSAEKERCFFEIWTRHESYVKLLGTGVRDIALPIPENVSMQTFLLLEKFAVSCCMFTESS